MSMRLRKLACLPIAAAVVSAGLAVGWTKNPEPADARILFPPSDVVLLYGTFHVIAKGIDGPLKVDGEVRPWDSFDAPLRVAAVGLSPGRHEIRIGDRRLEVVTAPNPYDHEAPDDWPVYRFHQIQVAERRCAGCHQTTERNGMTAVGAFKGPQACFDCHRPEQVAAHRGHRLKPGEDCRSCHDLHGSTRRFLLKPGVK
jgi:hypothetical protein